MFLSGRRTRLVTLSSLRIISVAVAAVWFAANANAGERPHSRLAVPGADGKLTYPAYSERGDRLPDFSWCGYRGGGVALPRPPVKVTLEPVAGEGDDLARIQKALDTVGEMPLDEKGFRGAVLLKKGTFRVGGTLNFNKSGVVLRGEGDGEDGTVVIASARKKYTVIMIGGSGAPKEFDDTKQEILADYVPVGSRTFKVKDASAYKVGDEVMVCREANQAWIDAIGMKEVNSWKPFTMKFMRVVKEVTNDTVTVDAPLVNPIDKQWGGGYLVRYEFPGRVENIGVEGIRCDSVYASPTDHAHAWEFISIRNAQNIWVRDCTALHFAYTAVEINSSVKWVTVQDTQCLDMISEKKGGLRYPFAIVGQLSLVQRCVAREGRHDFVMQYWVPGPNVFLDCRSENPQAESGCHQRYATGTLYDNVETGRISVVNRGESGSGHGWAGAQTVLWNCKAGSINIQQPPTAQNFAIGCIADKKMGNGHWESPNVPVAPRSLYLQQLEERLGPEGVKNIQP
jgi:hypothetical protein